MMVPLDDDKSDQDIFKSEYLELLYHLQHAIETEEVEVEGNKYSMDDFCYKPITGEGCLVTSPMGFWQMDLNKMLADEDVKKTAQCIPGENDDGRVCFDSIGVPVQVTAIFGGTTCVEDNTYPCAPCLIDASAYMVSFLLENNDYSNPTAVEWEQQVFIKNIKTFNHVVNYKDELPKEVDGYNMDLLDKLRNVYANNPNMIDIKIDYLAERSIPD